LDAFKNQISVSFPKEYIKLDFNFYFFSIFKNATNF